MGRALIWIFFGTEGAENKKLTPSPPNNDKNPNNNCKKKKHKKKSKDKPLVCSRKGSVNYVHRKY